MARKTIRNKILQLALVPALVVALLLGGGLTALYLQQLETLPQERGTATSTQLARLSQPLLEQGDTRLLQSLLEAALEERDIRGIAIFDRNGKAIVQIGPKIPLPRDLTLPGAAPAPLAGSQGSYHIAPIGPAAGGAEFGWLVIELTATPFVLAKYRGIVLALVCILVVLVCAAFMTLRLSRTISAPLKQLTQGIYRLAAGDMKTRISVSPGNEFNELAIAVNKMALMLEQSHREMQQHIDQSTDDLRETLETIEIQNIELDLARKEALEASRVKSAFLANTSHEIRTPLNGIIGFTNLLLKSELTGQQKEYLRTIESSSQGLLTIINDILDFSRIEAGKLVLDYVSLHLRQIIDQTLQILAPAAHKKKLQLISLIDHDVPLHLFGDPLRLKQVLTNLVSNAIKFSSKGNVIVRVERENQSILKFSVSDAGIGLSKAQQDNLFSAFSQADASSRRAQGGTGLGLAISKGLVERMGGDIGVHSRPGEGATFWFTAHLGIDHGADQETTYTGLNNRRVGIFETNAMVQLQLCHFFATWQVTPLEIDNVHDILPSVQRQKSAGEPVDLLIFDAYATDHAIATEALCGLINQLEQHFGCRTLVLTAPASQHQLAAELQDTGAVFVNRPLCHDRLYQAMAGQLQIAVDSVEDAAPVPKVRPLKDGQAPKVLVVDDNFANLKLVGELLTDLGVDTELARSGVEAIELCSKQRFDLIFMDIQMPGMDGLETSQRLRGREHRDQHTPIVALTAHALGEQRSQLLLSGMDDYLSKPASEAQLAHMINRWLETPASARAHAISSPALAPESPQVEESPVAEPVVDLAESLRLSNGKTTLAKDMLAMLIASLPGCMNSLQKAFRDADYPELEELVHQLHGGCCYCGVPRLKESSKALETRLQNGNYDDLEGLVGDLTGEINRLLRWVKTQNLDELFQQTSKPAVH
ncbi:response regulator [Exilibacterium tricleocarpae]|uniref:histidine kinase n=1 Tax=Exilibacterium tricleocarpae TaxID=2591008 RepID=A0A545U3M7_9GAMM|nr:response regulator [Exilibacterium tricleocarpae]TQV84087.1 response regulator [Exilibacterium tricleocarpae]